MSLYQAYTTLSRFTVYLSLHCTTGTTGTVYSCVISYPFFEKEKRSVAFFRRFMDFLLQPK